MKKLLFVCTGNSHRSILAESVVNKYHKDKFAGYSAGSKPSGIINKYVIKYLNENNFETKNLSSKNFNKFLDENTKFDQVFTVCNNASNEVCPVWPSPEKIIHWDIEDPVHIINELENSEKTNKEELISLEIHKTYSNLETRINEWIKNYEK